MFAETLMSHGSGPRWAGVLEALDRWVLTKGPKDLYRVNPLAVARSLGLDPGLTVDAFLAGVLGGWFDLGWDFLCPGCRGIPTSAAHLAEAHAGGFCPQCQVSFPNQLDGNVEVTFTATPKLAVFAPGEKESLGKVCCGDGALTGLDLILRPLFRDRFAGEVPAGGESLEIRSAVFLFTDIKGSTRLYETLGDSRAYTLVRDHFDVVFRAVESRGGVVVKTIGDAVMASFKKPLEALEAALEVHETIVSLKVPGTDESVVVKMGLHGGPAIAVNLNDRLDFFGQTVNRAARIQGLADHQEIYFSEGIFQDADCRKVLTNRKSAVRRLRTQLKGIEGDSVVYSIK